MHWLEAGVQELELRTEPRPFTVAWANTSLGKRSLLLLHMWSLSYGW